MTNPYYNRTYDVMPGNLVGSQGLEDQYQLIAQGFDALNLVMALLTGNAYTGIHNFIGATLRAAAPVGASDVVTLSYLQQVALGAAYPASGADIGKFLKATGVNTYAFSDITFAPGTALTTPVLTAPREVKVAMAANNIDTAAGSVFTKTISGATTLTVSNVPSAGTVASFILELTNPAANVTWWAGIKWAGGSLPTLTTTGRDVLAFYTWDGGTTWNGIVLGKNMS